LIHGPKARESFPEPLNVASGEQTYGNDAFIRHGLKSLIHVRNEYRMQLCRSFRSRFASIRPALFAPHSIAKARP
jgi:hypothetical protein